MNLILFVRIRKNTCILSGGYKSAHGGGLKNFGMGVDRP